MSLVKTKIFIWIPLLIFFVMFFDYFFTIGPVSIVAGELRTWAVVISSMALGLGVINLVRIHGKNIQKRKEGQWLYSIVALAIFFVVFVSGIIAKSGTLHQWFFQHVYTTLQQTMYASTGFYIVSSAYRAFRARNVDASLLLLAGCIVMLRNAPIGEVIWSGFPIIGDWLMDVGQLPAMRVFVLIGSFGLLAYGFRVLLAKERGFYGGGE